MINVGIIGCGFVGGALKDWLEHNNPDCKLFISDPPKGYNDDLSNIDIAFLQIHVPTEDDGTQDLSLMKELITNLPNVPVFVRTTILPGTSERLSRETKHQVWYTPEFLTDRTFLDHGVHGCTRTTYQNFCWQEIHCYDTLRGRIDKIYAQCIWCIQGDILQCLPRILRTDGSRLAQSAYGHTSLWLYQRHTHLRTRP